ncbi:MAG TPA: flagellar protein FhlB [Chromatiales bacterium]|nr:flagellar protein FhlB [Chromatiales bacterium]
MKQETDIAIALEYDGAHAPRVTAKGAGELARRIREVARQHDIPLHHDDQLVEILAQLELGEEIPETLYQVVAEIIAFIYVLKGKFPEGYAPYAPPEEPQP